MVMFVRSFCVCVILIACVQEEGSDIQNPMDVPVAGCVDAEPGAGVAQKKSKTKKVNWLITYGASGRNITARMLMETECLTVDECYTSRDSAHKYTLIHLEKRVSQTALESVVEAVCKRYGLVSNHVYGMEAIQSGTTDEFGSIRENPLLKWLVQDFEKGNPNFELWVAPEQASKALLRGNMRVKEEVFFRKLMKWPKERLVTTLLLERENARRLQQHADAMQAGQGASVRDVSGAIVA